MPEPTLYTKCQGDLQISSVGYMSLWGMYWVTWPAWAVVCYYLAFPRKIKLYKMALLAFFFCGKRIGSCDEAKLIWVAYTVVDKGCIGLSGGWSVGWLVGWLMYY